MQVLSLPPLPLPLDRPSAALPLIFELLLHDEPAPSEGGGGGGGGGGDYTRAFHGTAGTNLHSILRSGLQTLSGTAHQANGAARGAGVYLAQRATTSLVYCRPPLVSLLRSSEPALTSAHTPLLVCRVRTGEQLSDERIDRGDGVLVVADASRIAVTHLLLYPR